MSESNESYWERLSVALGDALTSKREEMGLSRAEAARLARCSPEMYGKYERGKSVPSLDTALRLARVLGFDVDELPAWRL